MAVIEVAKFHTTDPEELIRALPAMTAMLDTARGCRGASIRRCIENPDEFVLIAEWDGVADHEALVQSEEFVTWLQGVQHLFRQAPAAAHYGEPLG